MRYNIAHHLKEFIVEFDTTFDSLTAIHRTVYSRAGGAVTTPDAVKPKHKQLFEELGRAIETGAFVPGQRLPTEAELMQQYGVSRTTVTRTLRDLEHRGVIWRRRGSGTFVKHIERTATAQLGLLVHALEPGSIFLSVYESLARAADRTGAHVLLTHLNA